MLRIFSAKLALPWALQGLHILHNFRCFSTSSLTSLTPDIVFSSPVAYHCYTMNSRTTTDSMGAILTIIIFAGFGLAFAGFGVYTMLQAYPKQGSVAIIGGCVFIAFGLGFATLITFASISHLRDLRRVTANPDAPWLLTGAWNNAEKSDHPFGGAIGVWIIALICNGIITAGCCAMLTSPGKLSPAAAIILIFVALGIYLLVAAIRATLRAFYYGRSTLHLDTLPGQIGGHLSGTLRTERPIQAIGPARLRILCTRTDRIGRHLDTSTIWQNVLNVPEIQLDAGGSAISFDIETPDHLPPTSPPGANNPYITWKLQTSVAAHPLSYSTTFQVPMTGTASPPASSAPFSPVDFPPEAPPESNVAQAAPASEPHEHHGITLARLAGGGCSVHFAAARNLGITLIFTIIGAGLSVGLFYAQRAGAAWPVLGVLGLFTVIFDYGALNGWLASANVVAQRSGLSIDRGWPLIRFRKEVPAESITDIIDRVGLTAGNINYYELAAKTTDSHDPNPVPIARGMRDRDVARWIAAELLRSLRKQE
jgi:hypothetical protein